MSSSTGHYCICINGGWLSDSHGIPIFIEGGVPQIVNALLAVGNPVFLLDKTSYQVIGQTAEYTHNIPKIKDPATQIKIDTNYFLDPNYSFISAVIYSYANINAEIGEKTLGNDFLLVHNPNAHNPIPAGSFKCGDEYITVLNADGITISTINHEQRA